jgi:hypothetical protein
MSNWESDWHIAKGKVKAHLESIMDAESAKRKLNEFTRDISRRKLVEFLLGG